MSSSLSLLEEHHMFGGKQQRYKHAASSTRCEMTFSIFIPALKSTLPPPVVWCLAGLTCTDENFSVKSGAQRIAAELGLILVMPDTSPRGAEVADDEAYDLGQGAGFYLNATQAPWAENFQMYDYISSELPALIAAHFSVSDRQAILGHSMGGHGALTLALRQPGRFSSVSAFAPIVNPLNVPWGQKAFRAYLGNDVTAWQQYDACWLMRNTSGSLPMLIDQGDQDSFLTDQLQPECLDAIARDIAFPLILRMQPGYDHSYFFISSFIEDHLRFHAQHLLA